MLAVGNVRGNRRVGAERRVACAEPRRRQQRQIISPIHPQHAHATPPQPDRTANNVRHGHHPPIGDREPRGDSVA